MNTSPDFEADLDDEPYQFYVLGVWSKPDGYYISTDSGCSCPTPWENHSWDNPDDFTGPLTYEQVAAEAWGLATAHTWVHREIENMLAAMKDAAS